MARCLLLIASIFSSMKKLILLSTVQFWLHLPQTQIRHSGALCTNSTARSLYKNTLTVNLLPARDTNPQPSDECLLDLAFTSHGDLHLSDWSLCPYLWEPKSCHLNSSYGHWQRRPNPALLKQCATRTTFYLSYLRRNALPRRRKSRFFYLQAFSDS